MIAPSDGYEAVIRGETCDTATFARHGDLAQIESKTHHRIRVFVREGVVK
jgi:hypothetical protein